MTTFWSTAFSEDEEPTHDQLPPEIAPETLKERYRLEKRLTGGAMSPVWFAYDQVLQRPVVLKILKGTVVPEECLLTARLRHPAIIPLYEADVLEDGRWYYTMKPVEGEHFGDFWRRCYRERPQRALQELLDYLVRVSDAIAYAHQEGIIHRDLKPQNIVVSERFREVYVIDFGLSLRVEHSKEGRLEGTPAYMPPEQARRAMVGPAADLYALGAILYELLEQSPPWQQVADILPKLREGIVPLCRQGPPELQALCRWSMSPHPQDRPTSASDFSYSLRNFLEGAQKEERANQQWSALSGTEEKLLQQTLQLQSLSQQRLQKMEELSPFSEEVLRRPLWTLEDQIHALRLQKVSTTLELEQSLSAILQLSPNHPDAHHRLAALYQEQHREAEAKNDAASALLAEEKVRQHARSTQQLQWLKGEGSLSLSTSPSGLMVYGFREVDRERRRFPEWVGELGRTPLKELRLPAGSWRLKVGGHWLPLQIRREEHWHGSLPIPPLEADLCYVPEGECFLGDEEAPEGLMPGLRWVDGFWIHRFPVQVRDYFCFLEENRGELERWGPRWNNSEPAWRMEGGILVPTHDDIGPFQADHPITGVDWDCANAYADWYSRRTRQKWRLPNEYEWEKAARGVDGRRYSWGNTFQPTRACVPDTSTSPPARCSVHEYPLDESPYGVRGLVGNVRDWCSDVYTRLGLHESKKLNLDPSYRLTRGGTYECAPTLCAAAARTAQNPDERRKWLGFRLVRELS